MCRSFKAPPVHGFGAMDASDKSSSSALSTLYVGDLLPEVTEAHLQEKFGAIGPVALIHVCRDSVSRRSLGYAYVNYYSQIDAQQAMDKLNYSDIKGRCCRIMWSRRERPFRASEDANIFVKNLDPSIDSRALFETFGMFGAIISCKVASGPNGASRGYGFVQYEIEDAAKQAIERVNGMLIGGRKVFVGPFKKRGVDDDVKEGGENSLYARNFPEDMEDAEILKMFTEFGEIASSLFMNDTRSKKRHGFVNFKDVEAAKAAIEALNGKDMRSEEEKAAAAKEKTDVAEAEAEDQPTEATKKEDESAPDEAKDAETQEGEALEALKKEAEEEAAKPDKERLPSYCLSVSKAKSRSERNAEIRDQQEKRESRFEGIKLYVRNLPTDMKDDDLKALFEKYGTVTDVKAVTDRDTGIGKGYGFIRFATMEQATSAVEGMHLSEAVPGGPPLHVGLATARGAFGKDKGAGKGEGKGDGKGKGFKGKGKSKGKDAGPFAFAQYPMGPGMYPPQQPMAPMYYPQFSGLQPGAPQRPWPPTMPSQMGVMGPMMGQRPGMPFMPMMPHPGMPQPGMGMPPRPGMGMSPRPGMGMPPRPGAPLGMASQPPVAVAPQPLAASTPVNTAALAQAEPQKRKQMLGERLYPLIAKQEPELAGKITGMLLEMDDSELLMLLESEGTLREKVAEAVRVLKQGKPK